MRFFRFLERLKSNFVSLATTLVVLQGAISNHFLAPPHNKTYRGHKDGNLLLCSGLTANKVIKKYKSINMNFYSTPYKILDL